MPPLPRTAHRAAETRIRRALRLTTNFLMVLSRLLGLLGEMILLAAIAVVLAGLRPPAGS
jgi:hypothetical protein